MTDTAIYGLGRDGNYFGVERLDHLLSVVEAQCAGALRGFGAGVIAYPTADSFLVAEGTGKQVTIEAGAGLAAKDSYVLPLYTSVQATCSLMSDGTAFPDDGTIYIYATIENSGSNDTRETRTPKFVGSAASSYNGGLKLASVVLVSGAITTVTDLRTILVFGGDMTKDVYDTDDDGVVDEAANAQTLEGHAASHFATASDLSSHTGNTSNPHSVTKTQVGLGNVPNTDATLRSNHTGTQLASTISDFDSQVRGNRLDQMATPTADVAMGGYKLTGLADGVASTDAATVGQVDAARAGLSVKTPVRVATTANITLSGEQTIDGVAAVAGDRVLVKDQSTGSENGIYVCAVGSWSRATDADASAEVMPGLAVWVNEGTTNGDKRFALTTNAPITLGSTSLTFVQDSASSGVSSVNGASGTVVLDGGDLDSAVDDTTAYGGTPNSGTVEQLFGRVGRALKAITGESGWTSAPGTTISAIVTSLSQKAALAGAIFTGQVQNSFQGAASNDVTQDVFQAKPSGAMNTYYRAFAAYANGATAPQWHIGKDGEIVTNQPSGFSGNLIDLKVNGSSKAYINQSGALILSSYVFCTNVIPAATGIIEFTTRSSVRSSANGKLTLTNNAGTDFTALLFGGTTNSFPALNRSAATLVARLADDSANAGFVAKNYTLDNQSAPSTPSTGQQIIYGKTDKAPYAKNADGVEKSLWDRAPSALTDASTIAVDASLSCKFTVTLAGNRTLGNPTNAYDGQIIIFMIKQDLTGSRTLTLDTKYRFGTDLTSITLTTTASKMDRLVVMYDAAADKFDVVDFVKGF